MTAKTRRDGRVLIVDDDADTRDVLREFLESEGYVVRTAGNGRDAFAVLQDDTSPCGILLDLMMPVMDGWQFLERRRSDEHLSRIPVIILSALREPMPSDGVADVLPKPIDFTKLLTVVRRHCGCRSS